MTRYMMLALLMLVLSCTQRTTVPQSASTISAWSDSRRVPDFAADCSVQTMQSWVVEVAAVLGFTLERSYKLPPQTISYDVRPEWKEGEIVQLLFRDNQDRRNDGSFVRWYFVATISPSAAGSSVWFRKQDRVGPRLLDQTRFNEDWVRAFTELISDPGYTKRRK